MRKILDSRALAHRLGLEHGDVIALAQLGLVPVLDATGGRLWFDARAAEKALKRHAAEFNELAREIEENGPVLQKMIARFGERRDGGPEAAEV